MRLFVVFLFALSVPLAAAGAQHHDAKYLFGGQAPATNPAVLPGIYLLDATGSTPSIRHLLTPGFTSRFRMDADNRRVLVCVEGALTSSTLMPQGGMFRLDPATGTYTTFRHYTPTATTFVSAYEAEIDYNGDYVVPIYSFDRVVKPNHGIQLLKFRQDGTVVVIIPAGFTHHVTGKVTTDIDTGHILVANTHPPFPILAVDTQLDTVTPWHTGGARGFYGHYHLSQNHRTGAIEGPQGRVVHRVTRGSASVTTLAPLPVDVSGAGRNDLQTAPHPCLVFAGRVGTSGSALYRLDAATWAVTSVAIRSRRPQ